MKRWARHAGWLATLLGYVASRWMYARMGVGYDDQGISYIWQFLDEDQLRTNLVEALFYQHIQPPLYNLYLGIGLRFDWPYLFWLWSSRAFGLALHLGLYGLSRRLGAGRVISAFGAIAFAFSTASILYETWLFYTYPVAALLSVSGYAFHVAMTTQRPRHQGAAFLSMAAIVLLRSLFHLAWMVASVLLALFFSRRRKRTLLIAILPLLLGASVYIKNQVVFGRFAASTWMGMSLSRMTTLDAPQETRARLRREGRVSPLVFSIPWLTLDHYPPEYRVFPEGLPPVPVLTREMRRVGANENHAAYLRISDDFLADAKVMFRESPETYQSSLGRAWMIYFLPTHDYPFLAWRRPPLREIERIYELVQYTPEWSWSFGEQLPPLEGRWAIGWAVALPLILLASLRIAWRRRRSPSAPTILFCVGTILWVAVIGNSLEVGENNRFRFYSEPMVWALCAMVAQAILSWMAWRLRALRATLRLRT